MMICPWAGSKDCPRPGPCSSPTYGHTRPHERIDACGVTTSGCPGCIELGGDVVAGDRPECFGDWTGKDECNHCEHEEHCLTVTDTMEEEEQDEKAQQPGEASPT